MQTDNYTVCRMTFFIFTVYILAKYKCNVVDAVDLSLIVPASPSSGGQQ